MKNNANRFRCTVVGCNPKLYGENAAEAHKKDTGHRTAKWPVRSAEVKRRARQRNESGYYDKYNVGAKIAVSRGLVSAPSVESDYLNRLDIRIGNPVQLSSEGSAVYAGGEFWGWENPSEDEDMYEDFEDPGF